jgi:hypothetical protein
MRGISEFIGIKYAFSNLRAVKNSAYFMTINSGIAEHFSVLIVYI